MAKMTLSADLRKQAAEIKRTAEESGLQSNFFFATTFDRYLMQLEILESLKDAIKEHGMTVEKEYVKGRQNLCSNPAVADYNRTTDSANKTVACLMRILKNYGVDPADGDDDSLMSAIGDGEGNE